jgi:hypothetical protein
LGRIEIEVGQERQRLAVAGPAEHESAVPPHLGVVGLFEQLPDLGLGTRLLAESPGVGDQDLRQLIGRLNPPRLPPGFQVAQVVAGGLPVIGDSPEAHEDGHAEEDDEERDDE